MGINGLLGEMVTTMIRMIQTPLPRVWLEAFEDSQDLEDTNPNPV